MKPMRHQFRQRLFAGVCLGLLLCLPAAVNAESWAVLGQHVVQHGETLFCIGRGYGVDPWAIASQNQIIDVNLIHDGDKLAIPNAPASLPAGPTCAAQFTEAPASRCGQCTCRAERPVVSGDTLTHIAQEYSAAMQAIADCNCIHNLDLIYIGDTLCIP